MTERDERWIWLRDKYIAVMNVVKYRLPRKGDDPCSPLSPRLLVRLWRRLGA